MLEKTVLDGKEEMLSYSYDLFHMSSEKTKRIYQEENNEMMKFLIILIVVIIMILSYQR